MSSLKNFEDVGELGGKELEELYTWIDSFSLSRAKRHIARDFSDGVLIAEVIKQLFPKVVDVHNYVPANSTDQKMQNWMTLNRKVLRQFRLELPENVIRQIATAKPGVIERVLFILRMRLDLTQWDQQNPQALKAYENDRPEADQNATAQVNISPRRGTKASVNPPRGGGGGGKPGFKAAKNSQDEMVPLLLLEEKEQEVLAKNETIQILQAKIKRLEHLLHLKDIRIEDLQQRLESMRATGKR